MPKIRRTLIGARAALIPQDPLTALNPSRRIGPQITDRLIRILGWSGQRADARIRQLLDEVQIRDPDRVLFGTDEVAPQDQQTYLRVYRQYDPLWKLLDNGASEKVRKGNYERIFDAARTRVRNWERANLGPRKSATTNLQENAKSSTVPNATPQ